jgi:hypothetical protein
VPYKSSRQVKITKYALRINHCHALANGGRKTGKKRLLESSLNA